MNFLAHLWLAGDDEGLRLGAMLGDFVRGSLDGAEVAPWARCGILLHRFIDQYVDGLPEVARLRESFPAPFRRYSGIILDLAFDHELARRWSEFSTQPLDAYDRDLRLLLGRHDDLLPAGLKHFMQYADRRRLFAAYRERDEILHSLQGIGRRLSRPNPLHRCGEIWADLEPGLSDGFDAVFPLVRDRVNDWLNEDEPRRQRA
jgi:acyl carrier protein phosphodiesterase